MKRELICPYCHTGILVTWKRYWHSAAMHYRCPSCFKRSRIVTSPGWIQYTSWLVQLLPIAGLYLTRNIYVAAGIIPAYVLIFICDKKLDERYGVLKAAR